MSLRPHALPPRHLYAGPYVDRGGERRKDAEWVAALLASDRVRFVPVWRTMNLVRRLPEPAAVLWSAAEAAAALRQTAPIFLGEFREQYCFALELDAEATDAADAGFVDLRLAGGELSPEEAGLLAYARALVYWRNRHRYCGTCGSPAAPDSGGQVMRCTNAACGSESFPRLDPAIIVLVTDGERALLGRQASWPPQRYSTLAGFVEPGESLEDAVVREVAEEANVAVTAVSYHSSQPWPFPSSLMVGFIGQAAPGAEPRAGEELEDARWVTRDELIEGTIKLPPPVSISFRLIESWYEAEPGRRLVADLAQRGHSARW